MRRTIDETNRRRIIQIAYNEENGITPMNLAKTREQILERKTILDIRGGNQKKAYIEAEGPSIAADPVLNYMSRDQLEKAIEETQRKMKAAAKDLDFMSAASYRDEMMILKERLKRR